MRKRRPAPTNDEIRHAIDRAKAGKGRQLAAIVKSFSEDDLSYGFTAVGKYGTTCSASILGVHWARRSRSRRAARNTATISTSVSVMLGTER